MSQMDRLLTLSHFRIPGIALEVQMGAAPTLPSAWTVGPVSPSPTDLHRVAGDALLRYLVVYTLPTTTSDGTEAPGLTQGNCREMLAGVRDELLRVAEDSLTAARTATVYDLDHRIRVPFLVRTSATEFDVELLPTTGAFR